MVSSIGVLLGGCASGPRLAERAAAAQLPDRVELTNTPFHPQADQQCGPAALATVLGAAGHDVAPDLLARELFVPGREGSLQPEVVAGVRARGLLPYVLRPDFEEVLAEVASGRPVLVLQKQGLGPWPAWHYAVVNGYDAARGRVLLRSGTTRRLELPTSMFETSWLRADAWAIVVLDPGQMPARPDFERYMQAAAALEAVGQAHAASLAYTAAVRQWPAEPLPHLGLANLDAAAGRWRDAERAFADALRLDPHSAAALNNRAEALGRLGCPNAARTTLARGMAGVAPDDPLRPALERTQRDLDARAGVAAAADPDGCPPAAPP